MVQQNITDSFFALRGVEVNEVYPLLFHAPGRKEEKDSNTLRPYCIPPGLPALFLCAPGESLGEDAALSLPLHLHALGRVKKILLSLVREGKGRVVWIHLRAPGTHSASCTVIRALCHRAPGLLHELCIGHRANCRSCFSRLPVPSRKPTDFVAGLLLPLFKWSVSRNGGGCFEADSEDGASNLVDGKFDGHMDLQHQSFLKPGRHQESFDVPCPMQGRYFQNNRNMFNI